MASATLKAERPAMPSGLGSTSSIENPHIPGQYPASTPQPFENNGQGLQDARNSANGPLDAAGQKMSESKPSLATEHLKNDQRALHPMVLPVAPPRLTSDDALANGQLDHLVQKSTHTPETLSVKAAVPIQQDDSSFQSRFVEDLPDSVHSKPVSESQVNTTWHVHEPIVAEGAIPAAIAAKAQALATLQANALSPPDPSKDHKNWDDSNLQRALADDDHNKAQHALEQVDHAHTDRPEARQITSTQTLHDAPLSDRQSMQLDSVVPAAMTSEDSTKAPLQPHHLNADHELAMAQLLANTNGSPDALQQENGHTPQQAYSGPREVHQRELSMVAPATVAVSTEALEQMHQSSPTTQTHFNPSQSHPQTLQSADRAQSSGRGQAGMGGGNQHSAQVMRHNTAAPQQQKLYKSSPSQRKGPPPAASPVLMSSPQPSKLKRSMSRNSAISEQSSKQNYRDSVFASMSGVADPTTQNNFGPNQSLGQNRSLRSVFGAPIGMDDQRFSARSAPRAVQTAANDQDSEEDSDNTQHVHAAALPRSKSQRTNRSSYDTNEPIPRTQRRQSTVKRSQSSASRATRASMAPSTASRKSRVPESWWSAAPPGTEKRNGPKHFQVDKTGWMPHSWWEKPTERAVSFPGHNSIYSHHYDDDSDEVDDSDSDGPAPSRTYSTAGTLQRKKSLLPESYWSDKPKPRQSIQRSASRRSRVVYADQGDEDSSDQEGQKVARPKSRASKAPSRAASQRSRLSKPRPSGEATPQRSKSVRSTRASLIDGDRQPSRAPSRAASKLTRNSSRRTTQSTKSRAEVVDEPYTDDDPKHADVATAGVPSRAASRRSRRSEVPTMGEPSTATGFSSRNTSASRLAHQTDVEDDEDDEAGSYYKQSRKSLMRGEDTYVGA